MNSATADATLVRDRVMYLVGASDPLPRAVILEPIANDALDITSAEMLEQLITTLRSAGIDVALADLRQPVIDGRGEPDSSRPSATTGSSSRSPTPSGHSARARADARMVTPLSQRTN